MPEPTYIEPGKSLEEVNQRRAKKDQPPLRPEQVHVWNMEAGEFLPMIGVLPNPPKADVSPPVPEGVQSLGERLAVVRTKRDEAEALYQLTLGQVIDSLISLGMRPVDIARVVGLSRQRVYQLLAASS